MDAIAGERVAAALKAVAVLVVRHLIHDQSLASAAVLVQLDDGGPARMSELASASGVSQPSMTELVGRLERDDLVARFTDPEDKRATLVDITARGRTQRLKLQRSMSGRMIGLLQALPAEDQATLHLAMRASAPLINQLTHLAAHNPSFVGHRAPSRS
jgi:DNA-binding MarR family transcriptional regulator